MQDRCWKKERTYNFPKFKTIRSFGRDAKGGITTIDEAYEIQKCLDKTMGVLWVLLNLTL